MIIYIICTMMSIDTPTISVSNNPWDPRDGYTEQIEEENNDDNDDDDCEKVDDKK